MQNLFFRSFAKNLKGATWNIYSKNNLYDKVTQQLHEISTRRYFYVFTYRSKTYRSCHIACFIAARLYSLDVETGNPRNSIPILILTDAIAARD